MFRSIGFVLTLASSLLLFSELVSATTRPRGVRVRLDYERGAGAQSLAGIRRPDSSLVSGGSAPSRCRK
jgi:hypothetical protein